jgi:hypothetical protein
MRRQSTSATETWMCLKSIAGSYQRAMIYFLCWTFRPEKKHVNNYIPYVDIHLLMMDIDLVLATWDIHSSNRRAWE